MAVRRGFKKDALGTREKIEKKRCMEVHKEEKRKVMRCIYQSKKKGNEQFRRKMN